MKISFLVQRLKQIQTKHGDIDVTFVDMESYSSMKGPTPGALSVNNIKLESLRNRSTNELLKYVELGP